MQVYVNYPHPHITVHHNDACQHVRMHQKEEQRSYTVRPSNEAGIIVEFLSGKIVFKSDGNFNDLWFDISLGTREQDLEFVNRFQKIVGQRYGRLMTAPVSIHC